MYRIPKVEFDFGPIMRLPFFGLLTCAVMLGLLAGPAQAAPHGPQGPNAEATATASPNATSTRATAPSGIVRPEGTGDYDMFCSEPTPRPITNTNGCLGTITAYISGQFAWEVNRLELLSSAPSTRTRQSLNEWCDTHSFACMMVGVGVGAVFTILYGILTGGSTSSVPNATDTSRVPDATTHPLAGMGRLAV